jgi:hypothetical protein
LGFDLTASNTLKAAAFYRRDATSSGRDLRPALTEPRQTTVEHTTSIALEDTQKFGEKVDLVVGVSRDRRDLSDGQDFNANALVRYPLTDDDAWNGQAALIYRPTRDQPAARQRLVACALPDPVRALQLALRNGDPQPRRDGRAGGDQLRGRRQNAFQRQGRSRARCSTATCRTP